MRKYLIIFSILTGFSAVVWYSSEISKIWLKQPSGQQVPVALIASNELPPGSYLCEAENMTQGNGPYSLRCDKVGHKMTIRFPSGVHIVTDIHSEEADENMTWKIETTHPDTGDLWEIAITFGQL